ncbi:phage tail tube protein [Streptomyces sp. CBMA152]|uniref:phage tail tube protein n=1 Tax=Streptomyces sp. CBMA152 TaxID=1896312 RepID=UPI001660D54B|nr:phage tail tube protein [Streptomyces sp. CBMA152]
MTQISRLATVGLAKEVTPGTWLAPTIGIPFTKGDFEDMYTEVKDESYRGNDTVLQGVYQGVVHGEWQLDVMAYPDLAGHFLAGIIGPDVVSAGVSTTLSSSTIVGATSISTAASIPLGTTIAIDTAGNLEYATTGTPSGSGPYTIPITVPAGGLTKAHSSSVVVVGQTTHTFKQSTTPLPTYSLTIYDTTQTLSCSYCRLSDLQLKIDPKGAVTASLKYISFPSVVQSLQTETFSTYDPLLGWSWNMTNGGSSSTRGLTYDATIKRATEAIASSDGVQTPREVFAGPIEVDGTYKAIFENQLDMNLYINYTQTACTASLAQPVPRGGQSLSLTMSKSGWIKGKRDLSQPYVQADFSLSGIYNTTDGGAVQAVLKNFTSTQY